MSTNQQIVKSTINVLIVKLPISSSPFLELTIQYNLLINSPTGVFQNQFTCDNGKKE